MSQSIKLNTLVKLEETCTISSVGYLVVGIIFTKDKFTSKMCDVMFQHLDTCPGDVFSRILGACSIYGIHAFILGVQGIYFCSESRIDYLSDHVCLLKES
jgi:hypothetical protein